VATGANQVRGLKCALHRGSPSRRQPAPDGFGGRPYSKPVLYGGRAAKSIRLHGLQGNHLNPVAGAGTGFAQVLGGRSAQPLRPGQSPEGHRVALVRPVLREPLPPFAAAFRQGRRLGRGDRGWAKEAPPAVGHDPGV
jgi:hypothetical protein